jgi:hypothetical protein
VSYDYSRPPYEVQLRDWEGTDSFVRALIQQVQPTSEDYIRGILAEAVVHMRINAPVKTGALLSSLRVEVESPTRGRIVMIYYGVWVDRGHRVITPTMRGDKYRVRSDMTYKIGMKSANWVVRTKPARFITNAFNSPSVLAAKKNISLAFRRRQSN